MCDATDGITTQDLRIAELAMKSGCATALVLNKWDLAEEDRPRSRARDARAPEAAPAPASADRQRQTGRHVERLLVEAVALADRSRTRIPTPQLNRFLSETVAARQPPSGTARGAQPRLKLLFMTQTAERPPRFSIQVNSRARVTRDYAYFLENRLRERYRLEGDSARHRFRGAQRAAGGWRARRGLTVRECPSGRLPRYLLDLGPSRSDRGAVTPHPP